MKARCKEALLAVLLTCLLTGCAIHPLPDDVTGVDTRTIARQTRCEARSAIQKNLVDYLLFYPDGSPQKRLGNFFSDSSNLKFFKPEMFPEPQRTVIEKFSGTAVVYDFALDISEIDNLDATVDLLNPFHKGSSSAAVGLGLDRTREASRAFTLSDNFQDLLTSVNDDYCRGYGVNPNQIYPIVGETGIAEAVHQFIEMTLFDSLSGPSIKASDIVGGSTKGHDAVSKNKIKVRAAGKSRSDKDGSASSVISGPPTMTDTLIFTTKLSGSANPKIVFAPAGTAAHVMDASLLASTSRTDVHRVIIGFAVPASSSQELSTPPTVAGLFVSVRGGAAKQAAAQAIDQAYLRRGVSRGVGAILPLNTGD